MAPDNLDKSPRLKAIEAHQHFCYTLLKAVLEDHGVYSIDLWNDIVECITDIVAADCEYDLLMKTGVYELAQFYFPKEE